MIFFFGLRSTKIVEKQATIPCSHCEEKQVWFFIHQNYFHLFWIPVFPLWKSTTSVCAHCKQVLTKKEFSNALLDNYKIEVTKAKTPWWTFFLLIAFFALLVFSIILSQCS